MSATAWLTQKVADLILAWDDEITGPHDLGLPLPALESLKAKILILLATERREAEQETWEAAASCLDRAADTPIPAGAETAAIMVVIRDMLRQIASGFRARAAARSAEDARGEGETNGR